VHGLVLPEIRSFVVNKRKQLVQTYSHQVAGRRYNADENTFRCKCCSAILLDISEIYELAESVPFFVSAVT